MEDAGSVDSAGDLMARGHYGEYDIVAIETEQRRT